MRHTARLLGCVWFGWLAACSAEQPSSGTPSTRPSAPVSGSANPSSPTVPGNPAAAGTVAAPAAGSGALASTPAGNPQNATPSDAECAAGKPFKKVGCPCKAGETAACWTGSPADRNVGACHDGLQICSGGDEFASWGACMGEQQTCGTDAGVPPPTDDCGCIPGAVIQCSEDCSVGIICSLTATKTCMPDGTWSTCHEEAGVQLDLPGVQCRNMLHGCANILAPDTTSAAQGEGEIYVGDCSKQFKCGHTPPPPPPPTDMGPPQ